MPGTAELSTERRSVLGSASLALASVSVFPLAGCLGSPTFTIDEWDVAYRTETGSEWWPWLRVVVKNTGSARGTVDVTARISIKDGDVYTMRGSVSLQPNQVKTAIEGRPAANLVFEEGSRPRLVAAVWLDDARGAAKRETVAGDGA